MADIREKMAKRREPGAMIDTDICKEHGISLTTLADIAYDNR